MTIAFFSGGIKAWKIFNTLPAMADSSVQELIIKYKADISDLSAKVALIENKLRAAGKAGEEAGNKTKQGFDSAAKGAGNATAAIQPAAKLLENIGRNIAAAFAVEQVFSFAKESVKAFQDAEKNALVLQSAVGVNGGIQADFEELIRQSEELQKLSIFSDDSIQKAQTAALQFGLTKDQVQKLIPVIADFASATGQDLQSALDGVLQGINGVGRGLKIYGVTIDENGTSQSRLGDITEQLTKKFDGQAKAIGETSFGAAQKYKNEIDDLQEKIGKDLSPVLEALQLTLLKTTDVFFKASSGPANFAVELGKFASSAGEIQATIAERLSTLFTIDPTSFEKNFEKLKSIFKVKLEGNSVEELTKLYNQLAVAQEKLTGNARNLALAKQAAALDLLKEKAKGNIDVTEEEAQALAQLGIISSLSVIQLEALVKTLNKFNSITSRDAVKQINKVLEARKKADEEALKSAEENSKKLSELEGKLQQELTKEVADGPIAKLNAQQKIAEDEARIIFNASLKRKEDEENLTRALLAIQKIFNDKRVDAELEANDKIEKSRQALADNLSKADTGQRQIELDFKINDIDAQTQQVISSLEKSFGDIADFSKGAEQKLQSDILNAQLEGLKKQQQALKNAGADIIDIEKEIAAKEREIGQFRIQQQKEFAQARIELEKEIRDTIISGTEQVISESISKEAEADIQATNESLDVELASIDKKIEANNNARESDAISRKEFEDTNKRLLDERESAEAEAAAKIKAIKRQQFQADQIAAVSKIIIANTINAAEFPALAFLYAALAAVQIGLVLARPNPYKKGTKSAKEGTALVGEEGPELVVMPKGAKVLTAEKTERHADAVDAMIDGRFEEHVRKVFVEPALVKQAERLAESSISKEEITERIIKTVTNILNTTARENIHSDSFVQAFTIAEAAIISAGNKQSVKVPALSFQILPVKKSIKSESIDRENYMVEYINTVLSKLNVVEHLKTATEKHEIKKQELFAQNIANSFFQKESAIGLTMKQHRKLNSEGSPVTNSKEIARQIAKELSKVIPENNQTGRRYS